MNEGFTAKGALPDAEPDLIDTPSVKEAPATDEQLERQWADPRGLFGRLMSVQNDTIGRRLIFTGFFFLLLGGSVDSVLMRLQLAVPENTFLSPQLYNQLFTNHGSVTMFLVILPITEGFAILILPFLLGSREMPFPRLGVFAFFTFLMGGLLYYSSTLFDLVPNAGWFAYTPLSGPEYSPNRAMDFWLLGLSVAEIGAISGGIEIIIAILKMRAPGMSLSRMPLFAWAMLVMAFMLLFAFTPLIIGSFLLELDRKFGTQFFNVQGGGSDLLWQHLFWIFGHPEVYIQFLPAVGVVSMVLPVFVRRPIAGYTWIAASYIAIGFLSFGLWAHHMFAAGLPPIVLNFFAAASMAIGIPAGVQIFAWLATLWTGRPLWKTPFMFVIGFMAIFVIGGITGIMTASVPLDLQVHDSYFVVAHLHYVLIGGVAFPIFAAAYYWLPKWMGRLLDERLGQLNFWLMFIGVNVTFFPMHIVGLLGMPRRVYTYPAGLGWDIYNLISTMGVFIIVLGIFTFIANLIYSSRKGKPTGSNPWGADTLEWAVSSPPPNYGFSVTPIIRSRHPLWEQNDLHSGDPKLVHFVHTLASWPLKWRAALTCGTMDGQPEEVFRVSGPSIWPFVAAVGTVIIFFSEIFDLHLLTGFGALVIVASLIAWHWPDKAPMTEEEELAFERDTGVEVRAGGSRAVARWGMSLVILIIGIALTALLLTYFYLRLENTAWPPANLAPPQWPYALASTALLLGSAIPIYVALQGILAGNQQRLKLGLILAWLGAVAAVALQVFALRQEGFTWQAHAYASVFMVLSGFVLLITLVGLIMLGVVIFWAFRGSYSARRHVAIDNVLRFWVALVAVWWIGLGVLYATPYLT